MNTKPVDDAEMLAEYDFSKGVRGKYVNRLGPGKKIVTLEADVAEVFTDSAAVNEALRGLIALIRNETKNAQNHL